MNRSLSLCMMISLIALCAALLMAGCTAPLLPSLPASLSGVPDRSQGAFPSSPELGAAPPQVCDRAAYEAGFKTQYVRHWNWGIHDKEVLYRLKSGQHPGNMAARPNYALYRGKEMKGAETTAGVREYGLELNGKGQIRNDCEARSFTQGETAGMREAGRDLEALARQEM